jgi:hypothetical protein
MPMRLLAVFVGLLSLGQLLIALAFLGPHSDVPGQPVPSFVVIAAALWGFGLARAIWRRRAGTARGLAIWGVGVALCVVGLVLVVPSPSERRAAWRALAVGLSLWAALVALAAQRLAWDARTSTASGKGA